MTEYISCNYMHFCTFHAKFHTSITFIADFSNIFTSSRHVLTYVKTPVLNMENVKLRNSTFMLSLLLVFLIPCNIFMLILIVQNEISSLE